MTPEQLKASILQMAIQGKLVEQRKDEGTADQLISYIKSVKDKKIDNGELKAEKPLPEIKEDEVPFDIPDSWKWVRLGDYCEKITDQVASGSFASLRDNVPSLKEPNYAIMVKTADFANGFSSNLTYTTEHGYHFLENSNLFGGELILSNIGSIGKCFIVPDLGTKMTLAPNAIMLRLVNDSYRDYLYNFILSAQGYKELVEISSGTTMKKYNKTDLKKILIPVPPLMEQHRIVAKIEELLQYVDRYAKAYEKLEQFNSMFPEDMKKSILQYAIQGKLVEQRPEEGTAEELFKQIQEEKQRLIKEGKIKKEKPLSEISEDEIPFDIPDSWKWVRLQSVGELSRGKSKHRPRNDTSLYEGGGWPFIQTGDVAQTDYLISTWNIEYNDKGLAQSRLWPQGTLCLTIAANIGDVAILGFDACFPDSVVGFNAYNPIISNEFFLFGLMCYKTILDKKSRSTAQKNINIDILSGIAFPLPPLKEQERIVLRIKEMLPYCDLLKKRIG